MQETGYGSAQFRRACEVVALCERIDARGPRALWLRLRAGAPWLLVYRLRLPAVRVRLSASPAGRLIGEHLAIRRGRHWRYRRAQGLLVLPDEFPDYLRGRHRQAVRTNVARAREAGMAVDWQAIEGWVPGPDDSRAPHLTPGPIERWKVTREDGEIVAEAVLSVDGEVALLHGLVSEVTYSRWLLHTAIVERLCGECGVLLVNSDDAYLAAPGTQYFQRLLGYQIGRVRLVGRGREGLSATVRGAAARCRARAARWWRWRPSALGYRG